MDVFSIEEDLTKIEVSIRQLKIQYDMFFSGHLKRQPFESRKEVETLIETLGKTPMQRFADRFRYNTIATKYQSMAELWGKMIRAKEEGRLRPGVPGFVVPAVPPRETPPALRENRARRTARRPSRAPRPGSDDGQVRMLYDRYMQAKRAAAPGDGKPVPYAKFRDQIVAKSKALKTTSGCRNIRYSIETKGNRVVLKMSPAKEGDPK